MSAVEVQAGEGVSKSAKRRAAKKARDSAAEEAAAPAPAPPAPEPKAKAKAKAKAEAAAPPVPEPKAEPKAKAKGKAKAKAEPEPPAPEPAAPKAKAKGKAKAKAEPEPPAPAPKAKGAAKAAAKAEAAPKAAAQPEPKAAAKGKAKAKAASKAAEKVEEEEKPKESAELSANYVIDDGSGGSWEVSSGLTKKQQKRKDRDSEQKAFQAGSHVGKAVPGMAPTNTIPGMAPPGASASKGASQSVSADVERILAMKTAGAVEEKAPEGNSSSATIRVPEPKIGIVIGPKGSKIKMIQEKTGVTRIDTTGDVFTITGPPQAVSQAETAIKELIEKGYCSLQYDDFSENFVNVHPSYFPDLIGKQGAVVRKIKEALNVEINFPETQKNANSGKKYKVGLAGTAQAVEQAKTVINNIMMYSHDALTHPDQVHAELEIEEWAWRYIIGTAGSEMRHIQNNYKVQVKIPRETSLNPKVLVVGEKLMVDRAQAYIEKLVWNAEHKTTGRDKVDDGDAWGDEGPEEEWMKAYLYKR